LSNEKSYFYKRVYWDFKSEIPSLKFGTINAPIARKDGSIIERCVSENGQTAITHYDVIKEFDENALSLVHFVLETR